MSVVEQYTNELHKKFGYYATWMPGKKLVIGDVGKLNGRVFERETSLKNLGIEFQVIVDDTKMDLDYKSEGAVDIKTKLSGQSPIVGSGLSEADAGLTLEFKKEKSVVFEAKGVLSHQIEDLVPVKAEVLKRFKDKTWEKDWVIITEMAVADSATILISNKNNNIIDLRAKSDIKANDLKLANAEACFSVLNTSGLETKIIAESELTPLFKIVGIKTKILGSAEVASKGVDDENIFGEIDFE